MAAQRMAFREAGMIEVAGGIVCHAQCFHHAARAKISGDCERNHALELQFFEAAAKRCARTLGCQTAAPVVEGKPPTNLDSGHKWHIEVRNGKPDESDECILFEIFNREGPESVLYEMRLGAIEQLVRGLRC